MLPHPGKIAIDMRPSGRAPGEPRPVRIETGPFDRAFPALPKGAPRPTDHAALIGMGRTEILCVARIAQRLPPFLRDQPGGWITADFHMPPEPAPGRHGRQSRPSGRTQEIRRLIARALRMSTDPALLDRIMITLDCHVLRADGGTRCAAVTGAWVALALALGQMRTRTPGLAPPRLVQIAAMSCAVTDHGCIVDPDYAEDSTAIADANFVFAADGRIVEIQGSAERAPFEETTLREMIALARGGSALLFAAQTRALETRALETGAPAAISMTTDKAFIA